MTIANFLTRIFRDERGTSAVEYGLICVGIVIALVSALRGVANESEATWSRVSSKTSEAVDSATGN